MHNEASSHLTSAKLGSPAACSMAASGIGQKDKNKN